ncbi:MAG: TIGR03773 family transporter-associated surface protein [Dermatophilaceae bacterium]
MSASSSPTRRIRRVPVLALLAAMAMVAGLFASPLGATAAEPLVLDTGHVDVFHVSATDDGGLSLGLSEDVTGSDVKRDPEDVVLHVAESALMEGIPDIYPGAPRAYVLPLTQDPALLWPGWSTEELEGTSFSDVDIEITAVDGPGTIHLFTEGAGGEPTSVMRGGDVDLPGTIVVPSPSHVHANWLFSDPGRYELTVRAVSRLAGREVRSPEQGYTFTVGDQTGPTPTTSPSTTATPTPTTSPRPTNPAPTTPTTTPRPTTPAPSTVRLDRGHVDMFAVRPTSRGVDLTLKEDATGRSVIRRPEAVTLVVTDRARTRMPAGYPAAGQSVHLLPLTQDPQLLWPGWSTEALAGHRYPGADIVVHEVRGPGTVHVFSSGSLGGGVRPVLADGGTDLPGTIGVPRPAHVHANWVFTRPGTYRMVVSATGRGSGGERSAPSRRATYTVVVGGGSGAPPASAQVPPAPSGYGDDAASGGSLTERARSAAGSSTRAAGAAGAAGAAADRCTTVSDRAVAIPAGAVTSGHLDLGSRVEGGRLVASLKDDRGVPPRWVEPESQVLGLGPAARRTAPAGLEFIAPAGSAIWSIGSTQEAGIPWLGANTQHESVRSGTTGPVRWTLMSVEGPGEVAVFLSGPLGAGVGERQMDTVGGPRSFVVPANTHQHANWVFTAPGDYRLRIRQDATLTGGAAASDETTMRVVVAGDPAGTGERRAAACSTTQVASPTTTPTTAALSAGAGPRSAVGESSTAQAAVPASAGWTSSVGMLLTGAGLLAAGAALGWFAARRAAVPARS